MQFCRQQSVFPGSFRDRNRPVLVIYFKALETGEVSKIVPIDKLSVAIAMGLAFVILKEPIDVKSLIGGLFIVIGTLVIIW